MLWFYTKLKYFSEEDRVFLVITITEEVFNALSEPEQKKLKHLFSFIGANTTSQSLLSIVDYCKEVFLEGRGPFIFVINEGEDGHIIETKEAGSDYSNKMLTVRENSTNTLIGYIVGSSEAIQNIPYLSFPLSKNSIYRLRVQLETIAEDQPSGDGTLLLSTAYVIVPLKVDTDANTT